MSDQMEEPEVSGEGGEGKQEILEQPSVEHVELEAATTEPETVVERSVEYSEAEAIEAAFVDLVEPVSEASSEEGEYRVKTKIPWIHDTTDPDDEEALDDIASSTEADSQRGSYTLPEVGDEAVLDSGGLDPRDHYAGVEMQPGEVLQDQDWNEAESGGEVEVALGEADSELDVRADSATEGEQSTTREDAEGPPGEMAEAIPINIPHPRPDRAAEGEMQTTGEGAEGPPGEMAEAIPINIPPPKPDVTEGHMKPEFRNSLDTQLLASIQRIETNLSESARLKIEQAGAVLHEYVTSSHRSEEIYATATKTIRAQFGELPRSDSDELVAVVLSHTIATVEEVIGEIEDAVRASSGMEGSEPAGVQDEIATKSSWTQDEGASDESGRASASGAAKTADALSLAAMKDNALKEMWEVEKAKSEQMLQAQREHIQRLVDTIREMQKIYSQTMEAVNDINSS